MGWRSKKQRKPSVRVVEKGSLRGQDWRDFGYSNALVLDAERLRRKYSRDPEAMQLVTSGCTGSAYTYVVRNASLLARQPLKLYAKGGSSRRGRSVPKHQRKAMVKRWGGKIATAMDSAAEVREITSHPALDLLQRPNPIWSGVEMEELRFRFNMLTGNSYQMVTHEANGQIMLWPMPSQFTQVRADDFDIIGEYYFGRDQGDVLELSPDDVLHYRNRPDKFRTYMGEGDISHILPGIDLIRDVAIFDISFARNGYSPDHILKFGSDVTTDQLKELQGDMGSWWGNRRKVNLPYLLRGIENVFSLNTPPKDLRTPEQLEMYRKEIRQALGWTESMADSNDSTFAGSKVAEGQYGQYISDKLLSDASQKTAMFAQIFGFDPDEMFFAYDDPIAEDTEAERASQISMVGAGLATVNEARATLGMDPSTDENADVLMINGVPLGQSATANDPFAALLAGAGSRPVSDAGGSEDQSTGERNDEDAPPAPREESGKGADGPSSLDSRFESKDLIDIAMKAESGRWADDGHECGTKDDDDFGPNPILREVARRFLTPLQRASLGIVEQAQGEAVEAYGAGRTPDFARMQEAAVSDLSEALQPLIEMSMRSAMEDGSDVPADAFDVVPERAVRFLDSYVPQLADDIFETTAEMSRVAVQRGLEEGLTVRDVANAIEGVPAYRAERIARTELSNASHNGMVEGWKEAGIELVQWVTAPNPSAAHAEIAKRAPRPPGEVWVRAGETILGETFKRDVRHPPARPNCRCGLVPRLGEVE